MIDSYKRLRPARSSDQRSMGNVTATGTETQRERREECLSLPQTRIQMPMPIHTVDT